MTDRARKVYEDTADAAKEKVADAKGALRRMAVDTAGATKDKAVDATESAKGKAADVLDAVVEKTQDLSKEVRSSATDRLTRGSHQVGSRVKATGGSIHSVEDALRRHGQEHAADIASQAADRLEGAGSRLEDFGHRSLWARMGGFSKPWLPLAGALIVAVVVYQLLRGAGRRDA